MPEETDLLTQLAIKHGTDKWGVHFYTPIYNILFQGIRLRALQILEIGVGGYKYRNFGGESLRMWSEYFPNGRIVGIDIEPKELSLPANVSFECGSQSDLGFLDRLVSKRGAFDIVIDDGSHRLDDIIASFRFLFPKLNDGGLYVIEDTQTAFWPKWGGTPSGAKLLNFIGAAIQSIHRPEIKVVVPDYEPAEPMRSIRSLKVFHNLVVLEKGNDTGPSNFNFDPRHPIAQSALRSIENQIQRNPTPAAYAQYCAVLSHSGKVDVALEAIDKALQTWKDDPNLLRQGFEIAKLDGRDARALDYVSRLKEQSADPFIDQILAVLRSTKP